MHCKAAKSDSICHELKVLNHLVKRKMDVSAMEAGVDNVTIMHGWIICYLCDNSKKDVYQKDLETEFGISRSTVTNILKLMEQKGYIERVSVKSDARLKKLILTEKGININSLLRNTFDENETRINNILTSEEQKIFLSLLFKLHRGLEEF